MENLTSPRELKMAIKKEKEREAEEAGVRRERRQKQSLERAFGLR